jgi:hypothetical protein
VQCGDAGGSEGAIWRWGETSEAESVPGLLATAIGWAWKNCDTVKQKLTNTIASNDYRSSNKL